MRGPLCLFTILWLVFAMGATGAAAQSVNDPTPGNPGAQQIRFPQLRIVKKPGQQTGSVLVTIKGKNKILARHALQAWPIEDGEHALVLVASRKKTGGEEYHLFFYEGLTRKYRDLGTVPFAATELIEAKQSDGTWVFAVTGTYLEKPTIVLAGANGVHGMLQNASAPALHEDFLTFLDANGNPKTLPIGPLIAKDMTGIYEVNAPGSEKVRYVQFLRTGVAVVVGPDGQFHNAMWRTNGEAMIVTETDGSEVRWPRESLMPVTGIPAGTRLVVRLVQPLASEKTKEGDPVEAVLISPANINDSILIPQGSTFSGTVTNAHGVGWGLRRETPEMTIEFTSATLPDGSVLPIHTRLDRVENSRESVNEEGMIKGVRSTGTPGYTMERKVASVATLDPVAYLFSSVAAVAVLGFADPEIRYPAGTEMLVQFVSPAVTTRTYPRTVQEFPGSEEEQNKLRQLVRNLPFRTATQGSSKPSDITNLVFIGSPDGLRRAFSAAGWVAVDQLNAGSTFMTLKTVGGNQVYNQAPMSTLLLDERPPILTLTKTTNTFASRHHLRVFDPAMGYDGQTVLTSSSTQDIRVAFSSKQKTFIHVIDEYIDNERSKVVNDLEFTGCVEAMDLVPRPWVPLDAYNATGDRLRTDGAVAVMRISDCPSPRTTADTLAERSNRFKRNTRDTLLFIRADIYRGNPIYTGISGIRWTKKYFSTKDQLEPVAGAWRKTDLSGTQFEGIGNVPLDQQSSSSIVRDDDAPDERPELQGKALELLHRWDPPHYEIGIQAGHMRFPTNRNEFIAFNVVPDPDNPDPPFAGLIGDEFGHGWTTGISATLNSWKWFSNQFTYSYNDGVYELSAILSQPAGTLFHGSGGLVTRQFEYNLLWNFRPSESRWRPYTALGPALMLTSLSESPLKKSAGPFKLGLQNVGLLLAAYNFGSTAPLDGGGIFSAGLVYGAGFKFRVHPRMTWSVDFRETLSAGPNFLSDSYTKQYFEDADYNLQTFRSTSDSKYRQQRFTTGIAITF
jgi:hypothetical protein